MQVYVLIIQNIQTTKDIQLQINEFKHARRKIACIRVVTTYMSIRTPTSYPKSTNTKGITYNGT